MYLGPYHGTSRSTSMLMLNLVIITYVLTVELGGTELGMLSPLAFGGIIENQNWDFVTV